MTLQFFFASASAVIGFVCFFPYLRDIFRHTTKPHSYSWFIWALLQTIGVIAMLSAGAGIGVASLAIGAVYCLLIWILSLRYGTHNITIFDKVCLVGGLIALAIYLFLKDPLLSVIVVALTDLIGFLPTFRKSYEEPHTETALMYFLIMASHALALGALTSFTVATSLYLSSLIVTNGICVLIILIRRRRIATAH